VKKQLRGQRYETTEAIQKAVRQCLRMAGTEFCRRGIFKLPERWEIYVYKEVAIMWINKESYVDWGGVFGLSIIQRVTLQKIVVHDFRYVIKRLCFGCHFVCFILAVEK
jgi:GTP cyclohydrolase I